MKQKKRIKKQCKRILALMLCVVLNATCFDGLLGNYRSVNEVKAADIGTYDNEATLTKDSSETINIYNNLELYGDAIMTDDGSIQLTPLATWCSGSAWYKNKIDSKYGFTTSLSYWAGGGQNDYFGGADGIILTFSDIDGLGEDGGYLGFVNGSDNYGIELDSYAHNANDPVSKHIAIIKGTTSNHLTYKIDERVDDSTWHKLKVEYLKETLNVYLDEILVLSQNNVDLPNEIYLGVSAATGANKNRHLIKDFKATGYHVSKISKENYCLEFLDEKGEALKNVNVTFDNQTGITDEYGEVQFHVSNINSTPIIKASKENYRTWDTTNLNYRLSENLYDSIILLPTTADPLSLSNIQYSVAADMRFPVNLRTRTKKLNLKNTGNYIGDLTDGNFFIQCKAFEENQVSRYELWQGTTKIDECQTGMFELNVSDGFVSGGNCYIRVVGKLGATYDTPINLKFVENHVNKTDSMKLGEKITFEVGDDSIPYFGASTIEIDYPLIPLDFEISEEKIHIGFNVDLKPDAENDQKKKIEEVKKTMETLRKFKNNLDKRNMNIVNRMIKHSDSLKLPGGDFDVKVIGYAEGDIGSSEIKAELYLLIEAQTKTFGFNTMVSFIPVTVQVDAGCEGTIGGEFTYNWSKNTTNEGLKVSISPELNAFGGAGIGKAVGVGAYGTAKVDIEGQLLGTNPGLRKIDLTGELGLKAYLAFLTYERAFAHNTWHLYSENEVNEASINTNSNMDNNPYEADNYKVESLEYLNEEVMYECNEVPVLSTNEETEFSTLIANTYRNAQPVMVSNGEILLAAFLQADPMTNQVYVSCSKFEEGQWCQPLRIDDTSLLDGTPQLIVGEEGSIWLAYTQTALGTDGTDILEFAKNQRVVVGKIDSKTLEFMKSAEYESIGYAHMPTLEIVDGTPILAWNVSNITDANSVLTPDTSNIYYATYNNNGWSEAKILATIEHPICEMVIGDEGIACNIDTDNNLLTYDDLALTVYQWGGTSRIIASGVTGHIGYAKIPGTIEKAFVWNTKDMLVSSDTTVSVSGITNDYVITDNNIYFSASNHNASNLYVKSYENDCWSEVIQLTEGKRYFENLNVTALNGVDYVMGMYTLANITDTCIDVDKNLVWAMVNSVNDLRIDGVTYNDSGISVGDEVIVTAVVSNAGNHAVNGFKILVNDEVLLETNDVLEVGQNKEVSFSLNCPSYATEYKMVVVNTENSLNNDYREEDNEVTFVLGQANLVLDLSVQEVAGNRTLIASVINQGIEETSGTVTFYDNDNQEIMDQPFETLKSGDSALIKCKIEGVSGTYHAVVSNGENENYLFDNEDYLYMDSSTITAVPTMTTEPTITTKPTATVAPTATPTVTDIPLITVEPTVTEVATVTNVPTITVAPTVTKPPVATKAPKVTKKATPTPAVKAPGRPVIKSVKNTGKGKLTIKLKKKVTGAKGYQFVYATNKKFTKNKKILTTKSTSKTIKKLKKGKTYYVKVRAYKVSNGKKVYGKYCSVKKVKIKK